MIKKTFFALVLISGLLFNSIGILPVNAAAYGTSFTTSITYQNVGTADANVVILFYPEANGTPITITRPALRPLAGTSVYVGSLTELSAGFKGSAVINSDQPLVATLVQVASSTSSVKVRPLSNGFTTGGAEVGVPTVLKNTFNTNSIVVVQNVDTNGADLTLDFVPLSGSPVQLTLANLPSGAAKYYDLGQLTQLGTSFNGALKISAKKTGTSDPGNIVATAMELGTTSDAAYAFEGTTTSGTKVYMPSALCKLSGTATTAYAVQNVSTTDISVTVKYSSGINDGPFTIHSGGKQSFDGCAVNANGFLGSAIIEATGGNIVAVGKVYGGGLSTAFLGFTSGTSKVGLPYVRYTQTHWTDGTRQRAFIAIQNVGSTDIAAGQTTVKYFDKNGNLVGTHILSSIPIGGKVNSNASMVGSAANEFGYYSDGTFGGSAVVEGPTGSQLAVVVRIVTYVSSVEIAGEDYTGIPIP